jgi:hypothetical protein
MDRARNLLAAVFAVAFTGAAASTASVQTTAQVTLPLLIVAATSENGALVPLRRTVTSSTAASLGRHMGYRV